MTDYNSNQEPPHLVITRQSNPYHHHVQPYGQLGEPYVISKHTLLYPEDNVSTVAVYETKAATKSTTSTTKWSAFQRRRLSQQLNMCFPFLYVVTHLSCLILNSIIQIGLQIALMSTNGALWWVGAGIWTGVYMIITALVTLLLVYNRSYCTFVISYLMHLFGVLVAIGGYLVVNIIGISEYTDRCSYYPNCFNQNVKPISYILFWLGVICIIMLLLYLVLMPCCIMDTLNQRKKYAEEKANASVIRQNSSITAGPLMHSSLYVQADMSDINEINAEPRFYQAKQGYENAYFQYPQRNFI